MGNRRGTPPERTSEDDEQYDEHWREDDPHQTTLEEAGDEAGEKSSSVAASAGSAGAAGASSAGTAGASLAGIAATSVEESSSTAKDEGEPESEDEDDEDQSTELPDLDNPDPTDEFEFIYGDIVVDREEQPIEGERTRYVVVNIPESRIDEWEHESYREGAGYPDFDYVVIVVRRAILDEEFTNWDKRTEDIPLERLEENNIQFESFPSLRLQLDEPSHLRDA